MTSQLVLLSSHIALDAIKTLKELALFHEHNPGFAGLHKALSTAETVLQQEFHTLLSTPTLENWFKLNNMSKKGFAVVSEMVNLMMENSEL
jgi:hypothetical protein